MAKDSNNNKDAVEAVRKLPTPVTVLPLKPNTDNLKPTPLACQNLIPEIIKDLTGFWNLCLVLPEKIILSWLKFPKLDSSVTDKLKADTTVILKPSAKLSTSVPLTAKVVFPNTHSCAPMVPFSTKGISSVIGGSISTAPRPKGSTA